MPVVAVDGRPIARGPAAAALQEALRREASSLTDRRWTAVRPLRAARELLAAVDHEVRAADGIVALDVAILRRHPPRRPTSTRAASPSRATPRASRTSYGASTQTRTAYASRSVRWSAHTPSTMTMPARLDRPRSRAACAPPSRTTRTGRRRRADSGATTSAARRSMSKPSPVQNSSVDTICAPGIIRASVVFPAPPCPPIPTRTIVVALAGGCDRGRAPAVRPSPHGTLSAWRSCGSAAWLSRTASSSTARPSWGAAVRAADGSIRSASGHQAALRART